MTIILLIEVYLEPKFRQECQILCLANKSCWFLGLSRNEHANDSGTVEKWLFVVVVFLFPAKYEKRTETQRVLRPGHRLTAESQASGVLSETVGVEFALPA